MSALEPAFERTELECSRNLLSALNEYANQLFVLKLSRKRQEICKRAACALEMAACTRERA